jgi:succinyl-CoA synthetase alpha subunit
MIPLEGVPATADLLSAYRLNERRGPMVFGRNCPTGMTGKVDGAAAM